MPEKKNPYGLIGLVIVLGMLIAALVVDRKGRSEAQAAADRVAALLAAESNPTKIIEPQNATPTRDEVQAIIGKKPDGPAIPGEMGQYEVYSFGSLRRYHLFVYYTKGKRPHLLRFSLFQKAS